MQELLKTFIKEIDIITNHNEMATGLIAVGIGSFVIMLFRSWYQKLKNITIRNFTTKVTIDSDNIVYHDIMKYLSTSGVIDKSMYVNLSSGRWGHGPLIKAFGEGVQIVKILDQYVLMTVSKIELSGGLLYTTKFRYFGRNHSFIDKIQKKLRSKNTNTRYMIHKKDTSYRTGVIKNLLPPVLTEEVQGLVDRVLNFKNKKDKYVKQGIPYSYGLLLHGVGGTGKTNLIRYIMNELHYPTYLINSLEELEGVPMAGKVLVVLEEVDGMIHGNRDKKKEGEEYLHSNITGFLKALDGVEPADGRIVLATTNHVDKLDPAFIRKGRFDKLVKLGYLSAEDILKFADRYYGDTYQVFNEPTLRQIEGSPIKITGADVADAYLIKEDREEFLAEFITYL